MRHASAFLVSATLVSACTAASDRASPKDLATARAQLDSMWSGLTVAMTAGDTVAVATFYTDSAYFAETGSPTLRGRPAILSATAGVFACCRYIESRQHIERTELVGDRALQFGTYRDVIQPTGQVAIALHGRFDAVLERDAAGRWRVARLVVIRDSTVELSLDVH